MAQQFGYAILRAQAQTAEGLIPAANPAQPSFEAGSVCVVSASFFDNTGQAMVPEVLSYQINDLATGAVILAPTVITNPLSVQPIEITGEQNAMVSNSRDSETHAVTLTITDRNNLTPFLARCVFDLTRVFGVA